MLKMQAATRIFEVLIYKVISRREVLKFQYSFVKFLFIWRLRSIQVHVFRLVYSLACTFGVWTLTFCWIDRCKKLSPCTLLNISRNSIQNEQNIQKNTYSSVRLYTSMNSVARMFRLRPYFDNFTQRSVNLLSRFKLCLVVDQWI